MNASTVTFGADGTVAGGGGAASPDVDETHGPDPSEQTFAEREFVKSFAAHARRREVLAALHSDSIEPDLRRRLVLAVERCMKRSTNPAEWYTPRAWSIDLGENPPAAASDLVLGLAMTFIAAQEEQVVKGGMTLLEAARAFGSSW